MLILDSKFFFGTFNIPKEPILETLFTLSNHKTLSALSPSKINQFPSSFLIFNANPGRQLQIKAKNPGKFSQKFTQAIFSLNKK